MGQMTTITHLAFFCRDDRRDFKKQRQGESVMRELAIILRTPETQKIRNHFDFRGGQFPQPDEIWSKMND